MRKDKDGQEAYELADLDRLTSLFNAAQHYWAWLCNEAAILRVENGGRRDEGTCVLGAGIEVPVIEKGKRACRWKIIAGGYQAGTGQGASTWEGPPLERTLKFLRDNGVKHARYNHGVVD